MEREALQMCLEYIETNAHERKHVRHAIQAALAQPAQEPRNVRERWNVELDGNDLLVCFNDHEKGDKCQYERYSPQRTWVGLTAEETSGFTSQEMTVVKYVSKVLQEKNNGT